MNNTNLDPVVPVQPVRLLSYLNAPFYDTPMYLGTASAVPCANGMKGPLPAVLLKFQCVTLFSRRYRDRDAYTD